MQKEIMINNQQIKYQVMSVNRLPELQEHFDKLESEGKISNNATFRSYICDFKYQVPENFQDAKYIVILAIEHNLAKINFHINGEKHEIIFTSPYHKLEVSVEEMAEAILNEIIKLPGYRVEYNRTMPLKLLAVRSGLGRYGRNNICYVEGLGSYLSIYTFFTNFDFKEDNWHEIQMLDECKNCNICINKCPTQAISRDDFVIDIERCLPLYNEVPGTIPEWIDPTAHNSLMGCIICQKYCPANKKAVQKIIQLEDITEEETKVLLEGQQDEKLIDSIGKKLRRFDNKTAYYFLPIFKRNLELLIK